jgi:hypothetical protein
MRPTLVVTVAALILAAAAGCDSGKPQTQAPPEISTVVTPSDGPATPAPGVSPSRGAGGSPAAPAVWPNPEDCLSYNPGNLRNQYEAGIHQIMDGSRVVLRLHGGPGETIGQQGLALARRYRKHCYVGRGNTREEKGEYVFDYWREPSGNTPSIPDENCSGYNRNNLTVEDMGSGHGWRVKDHDHVLQQFDNESDARNGKLVLSKYSRICFIDQGYDGLDRDPVSYFP